MKTRSQIIERRSKIYHKRNARLFHEQPHHNDFVSRSQFNHPNWLLSRKLERSWVRWVLAREPDRKLIVQDYGIDWEAWRLRGCFMRVEL